MDLRDERVRQRAYELWEQSGARRVRWIQNVKLATSKQRKHRLRSRQGQYNFFLVRIMRRILSQTSSSAKKRGIEKPYVVEHRTISGGGT